MSENVPQKSEGNFSFFFFNIIKVHKNDFHYDNGTCFWHDGDIQHIFIDLK